jgi:GDP-L-fucose synthase
MFYTGKTVLVTGGTGFVGTHFVEALLEQGAKVRVPIHERPLLVKKERIETIKADLTRLEDCLRATEGIDDVIHAAGSVGSAAVTGYSQKVMAGITANLILTAQMLQAAWATGVKRFLLFSSSTVYPVTKHPVKEEEMWNGPPYAAYLGYGWMRRYFEKLGEFVASESSMKIALVRPSAVYGRWDNFDPATGHVIPALIRRAVERQNPYLVWGTGEEVRDFLHITDLVRGCLLALEKYAVGEPINLGYGQAVTIREVVDLILKAANHDQAIVQFDHSKPNAISFRMVDISKAKQILNFEPQLSLADGLWDTVKWYEQIQG